MIGQRFGNYRALSLLGEGGMGAVYLAEHPDIGRRVAIKVLRTELTKDPGLLQRFLNEARAANAIRHPNIIEILDSGTTPEGTPYLVMELLEGEVLSLRIQRLGKLALGEALELAYQAASALAAAHGKGIIHRDLKPDNLFIVRDPVDGGRERIKVLDFGIAKLQTFPNAGGMQTRTGTLMGTPVYMSPEQCLGTKVIDARSDIYALGVILFEMLAGHPPFVSDGFGELVNMHLNLKPPFLGVVEPMVPEGVARLVDRMLAKHPDARPQSAAELQRSIRDAAGKGIVIRGFSSPDLTGGTMPYVGASTAEATNEGAATSAPRSGAPRSASGPRAFPGATTLSTGVGERAEASSPRGRGAGRRTVFVALAVTGLGLAIAAGVQRGRRAQQTAQESAPGGARSTASAAERSTTEPPRAQSSPGPHPEATDRERAPIHITLQSQPSGAAVTDVNAGAPLGTTPLVLERSAGGGPITLRLEKEGYASLTRTFSVDRDRTETLTLWASALERQGGGQGRNKEPTPAPNQEPTEDRGRERRTSRADEPRKNERSKRTVRPRQVAAPEDEPAKL